MSSRTDPIQFRPEAAGERPSHEGGATTTAEVRAQGPPQSAGAVRGSDRTTDRQGGMVDVRPAKDGAHRPPQSAGAVRRQASASRQPHPASLSIRHHLCPERLTTYSSSSQGSGNSSSSILISTKSRACRILASRVRGGSGDTDTTRPQGDTNDFNSSAKKDRQTTVKATTEGPSSSATAGDHGAVGKRNSPVIGILRRGKNWTRTCGIRTTHRPRCGYRGSGASTWAAKAELVLLVAGVR